MLQMCHSSHESLRIRLRGFFVVFLMLSEPVAAERQSIGIFGQWGAFRQQQPMRCFAIAQPARGPRPEGWAPFASVSYSPQRGAAGQVHVRLSRQKRQASAILLRIDDRTFQLVGGGADAWAPDSRADREIVRALRRGVGMSVETRSVRGALVRDYYQLRGAATAIDAAAIDCARRR
jgi:hypothetical protein